MANRVIRKSGQSTGSLPVVSVADVLGLNTVLNDKISSTDLNDRFNELVGTSQATLDTIEELGNALGDDANFATTTALALAGKANVNHEHDISDVTDLQSALNAKANSDDLATVATTGSYNDLNDKPAASAGGGGGFPEIFMLMGV